jgi:hypothetical protein
MAKGKGEVVAFNLGEIGAEALARTDLDVYPRGAETMENIFPLVQGGMTKMPGTEYSGVTPSSAPALLSAFVFSETEKLALEWSDNRLRMYSDGSLVVLPGAVATVGTFTDESGTVPAGGGTAPSGGGTGDVYPSGGWTGDVYPFRGWRSGQFGNGILP